MAVLIGLLSMNWCLLASVCLLWPGAGTPSPDEDLPGGFEGDRLEFELLVLGLLVALLLVCFAFHALGRSADGRRPVGRRATVTARRA